MNSLIHPTAIVHPGARIGKNTSVGPYTVIENNVVIGEGGSIGPHVFIGEYTTIGKSCSIFHGASVGTIAQDLKYKNELTTLRIGDNVIIREFCTLNRGTVENGETVIGNDCVFLSYCHVAHDCVVGNRVILSNNAGLAGHARIGNHVNIAPFTGVHQFCRIGDYAFVSPQLVIRKDIIPFALFGGSVDSPYIIGINKVGLERNGFDEQRRQKIKRVFKILFRKGLLLNEALTALDESFSGDQDVDLLKKFVLDSQRSIYRMEQ